MKPVCYVCVGLPGSGKSTWANSQNLPVVSTDTIRGILFGDESIQSNPKKVFSVAFAQIMNFLKNDNDCIFDATNLTKRNRANVLKIIKPYDAIAVYFNCDVETCIKRQNLRDRKVPTEVIENMAKRISIPTIEEGFKKIIYV